jgi:hypothetical protein
MFPRDYLKRRDQTAFATSLTLRQPYLKRSRSLKIEAHSADKEHHNHAPGTGVRVRPYIT